MTKQRTNISSTDKVKALKRHLVEKEAVSDICDDLGIAPSAFYKWLQKFFEDGEVVFETSRKHASSPKDKEQEQCRLLRERVQQREEALAELMAEHVALKKRSIGLV